MTKYRTFIASLSNSLTVLILLMALLIQTNSQTLSLFSETTFDLAQIDLEDSNEEAKEVKDTLDEKPELQFYNSNIYYLLAKYSKLNSYTVQLLINTVSLEIPIPPPDCI